MARFLVVGGGLRCCCHAASIHDFCKVR
jgi:hypothetical protein